MRYPTEKHENQELYASIFELSDQLAITKLVDLNTFQPYISRRDEQRLVQFFMALCYDFEGLCGYIFHRAPPPTVDLVVHELIAENLPSS